MRKLMGTIVFGLFMSSTLAQAETVSLAVQTGGILPIIANGIAKVASEHGGVATRARELGGDTQFIPMVNAGQIDLGLTNSYQLVFAYTGTSILKGRVHPDVRMAFALMPLTIGIAVRTDSGIRTVADLKGKRLPGGFSSLRTGNLMWGSILANAGLTRTDVKTIPVSNYLAMWNQFKQGKLDACNMVIGGATAKDVSAAVGGLRYIRWNEDPKSIAAMRNVEPGTTVEAIQPPPEAGKPHPVTNAQFIRFIIFASTKTSPDVVYKVTKAVYENAAVLKKQGPLWRRFDPTKMAIDFGVPFHDGAARLFREKGQWPPAK